MSDDLTGRRVHVYEYGEAFDDLRAAFYIDESAYDDPDLARTNLEIADAALTRLGVIYSVVVTSGADAQRPYGLPTWEEFWQRHFVDGVPLPVRPRPSKVTMPPSWEAMSAALAADHVRFRDELVGLLATAFPGGEVSVQADQGPLRRSPGSIDPSEERYGFELALRADTSGREPAEALDRMTAVLRDRGWHSDGPSGTTVEASRVGYELWMQAEPGYVLVEADSPLYRAPAEPGSSFVVEPRGTVPEQP